MGATRNTTTSSAEPSQGLLFDKPGEAETFARTIIGEHLADQLLLPLAIGAGGSFTTTPLSTHSVTNIDTIHKFAARTITTEPVSNGIVRVMV